MSAWATWPRLRPASRRASLTEPGRISTPRRRPRRRPETALPEAVEPSVLAWDAPSTADLNGQLNAPLFGLMVPLQPQQQPGPVPPAATVIARLTNAEAARKAANSSLRIKLTSF